MTSINNRYSYLLKQSKSSLTYICKEKKFTYNKNSNRLELLHNILKNEYDGDIFINFINYSDVNPENYKQRYNNLKKLKNSELCNMLKNYNLTHNGSKKYLIERILAYEYYKKILTLEKQKTLDYYKYVHNLLYIPQVNYINDNYNNYDIDLIYKPYEFFNIEEYIKHLENLKALNNYVLINEHLSVLNQEWYQFVQYNLIEAGWNFNTINYDEVIMDTVNNKYKNNNDNTLTVNNIETYTYNSNTCENCIICMCAIEKNDKCKKLCCGHIFHSECIDTWLNRVLECPICRKNINKI